MGEILPIWNSVYFYLSLLRNVGRKRGHLYSIRGVFIFFAILHYLSFIIYIILDETFSLIHYLGEYVKAKCNITYIFL